MRVCPVPDGPARLFVKGDVGTEYASSRVVHLVISGLQGFYGSVPTPRCWPAYVVG